MNEIVSNVMQQLARVVSHSQEQRTGHPPTDVNVVLSGDMLVVTLHEALTPAEKDLSRSPEGAAQVQEFHRQLFADSTDDVRQEIKRITGREVREASAELESANGMAMHAFATGAMVQIFMLAKETAAKTASEPLGLSWDDEV